MFLPTTEWRPVSQKPQYGLLPAIAGTLYVSAIAVVLALIFGVACACFLDYYLPKKVASLFLAFCHRSGCRNPVRHLRIYRTYGSCKSLCHPPPYGSRSMSPGSRDRAGDHAFTIRYFHLFMNLYRLHEDLRVQCDHTWILQRIYPAGILFSGNPAGIIAGAMMAFGRALGETMAVMMVIGNPRFIPNSLDVVRRFLPPPH